MAMTEQYTIEQMAEALRLTGGMRSHAAKQLKCSPTTVANYIERYDSLKQVETDAAEATLDLAESQLIRQIKKGQAWAICFFLKTKGKERGYIERSELTGKDGDPLMHNLKMPSDERSAKIEHLQDRLRVIDGGKAAG